jgi:hypothetical protein
VIYLLNAAVQFATTVIGVVVDPSVARLTRKRSPSALTAYSMRAFDVNPEKGAAPKSTAGVPTVRLRPSGDAVIGTALRLVSGPR